MKLGLFMLCVALALGAFVGCGGDDDEATAESLTTSSLSKAAYAKKAGETCKQSNKKMLDSILKYGETHAQGTAEQIARRAVLHSVPQALERQADEIRALGAPSGGAAQVEAFIEALGSVKEAIEEEPPTDIFKLQEALEPVNRPALAYGLEGCKV